ncbi:hypothetical protein F5Y11DRAFT_366257 [Daldinia sp. FL1419]|nr:hypothetical protein F5Y11DRAFT_366257 [Daldinia sp. FL1419]
MRLVTEVEKVERTGVLYFAYGSNLSSEQMRERCPLSTPIGLAYLPGWKWIINKRGYANIVQDKTDTTSGVFGVVYHMDPGDEESLDQCEGVPWAYERRFLDAVLVECADVLSGVKDLGEEEIALSGLKGNTRQIQALAYIDFQRVEPGRPMNEYIHRMNTGIKDAMEHWELPEEYVKSVIRPFIPTKAEE